MLGMLKFYQQLFLLINYYYSNFCNYLQKRVVRKGTGKGSGDYLMPDVAYSSTIYC